MRKQLVIGFLMLFILGCQDIDRPQKPDNLIDKEELTDILYDISLVNAVRSFNIQKLRISGIEPDKFIYDKYAIDSLQLAQSISYYSVDFNAYSKMWQEINTRIENKRDEVEKLKRTSDSLSRVKSSVFKDSLGKRSRVPDKKITDSIL
ncbi:MAG: DUF4296 domain-containing protein [Leeuwenhoekiella sp.]